MSHSNPPEDRNNFNRGFKTAIVMFAVMEFFVIALVVFYMSMR